jgi:hypothetical protein
VELPAGRFWLCLVADGEDGYRLAKAFAHVDLPKDASGAIKMFGSRVIGTASRSLPRPIQSIKLWSQINLAAARPGESVLAEDYTRVRFEIRVQAQFHLKRPLDIREVRHLGSRRYARDRAGSAPTTINRWAQGILRNSCYRALRRASPQAVRLVVGCRLREKGS